MEFVIAAVVVLVLAFVAYKRLPAVKTLVDGALKKATNAASPAAPKPLDRPNTVLTRPEFDFSPFKGWHQVDVERVRQQQGFAAMMTEEEKARARAAGVIIPFDAPATPGIDRSGFNITEAQGWIVTNTLANGQSYTFTLGRPGTVRVFGYAGTEVTKVNGEQVIGGKDFPNQSGTITFTVESIGGQVAVQLA